MEASLENRRWASAKGHCAARHAPTANHGKAIFEGGLRQSAASAYGCVAYWLSG
jgi:hypothetical protein